MHIKNSLRNACESPEPGRLRVKDGDGNEIKEGYVGFNYIGNILLATQKGYKCSRKNEIKTARKKGRKKRGKKKIPFRLAGYWISMSRPSEVSKTSPVGND